MNRSHYQRRGPQPHRGMSHSQHRDIQRTNSMPPMQPPPAVSPHSLPPAGAAYEEPPAPASNYEQVVRFVQEGWRKYEDGLHASTEKSKTCVYHTESEPNPKLKDFVPVNLEDLMKRRRQQQTPNHATS